MSFVEQWKAFQCYRLSFQLQGTSTFCTETAHNCRVIHLEICVTWEQRKERKECYRFKVVDWGPLRYFITSHPSHFLLCFYSFFVITSWVPSHHLSSSFSLLTPLPLSHFSTPCCILSYPPPHMSVCSKLEQRLNRGSETWREFLSSPGSAVHTQTHSHTHIHTQTNTFCFEAN